MSNRGTFYTLSLVSAVTVMEFLLLRKVGKAGQEACYRQRKSSQDYLGHCLSKNKNKKGGEPKSLNTYFLVNERDQYVKKSFA